MNTKTALISAIAASAFQLAAFAQTAAPAATPVPATSAAPATVFFTHDISPEGLVKAYKLVSLDGNEPPSTKRVD